MKLIRFDSTIIIIILLLINQINSIQNWNYDKYGPSVWSKDYPECGGQSQSPVNIKTACTIYKTFQPLEFQLIFQNKINFTLQNDGHTITATSNQPNLFVNGGNLDGIYKFANFHLHWGPNENEGSEHQVNSVKYSGETHFVFENILNKKLAVFAFFMKTQTNSFEKNKQNEIGYETMTEWRRYFDATQKLPKQNDTTTTDLNLALLIGDNHTDFWRYNGSLTIPPCTQDVTWTVFKQPIYIYNYEFDSFRDDLLFESYRGPQPLFHRIIHRSFQHEILSNIPDENCCIQNNNKSNSIFFYSNYFYLLLSLLLYRIIQ